ncbi:hypothetical protein AB0A69_26885 [Streptomyces sp. NPDC045431]|uniref:hypothetical protein n=1 Tax=Streptomyces sp. NPDC045431 TaxID=3155613 RepID=UPI0033D2F410
MPVRDLHRPLTYFVAAMAAVGVVSAVGLVVDDRVLLGMPIWEKPLKFALSLGAYAATLAWMLSLLDRGRRISWWAGTVIAAASSVEVALIIVQAARGKRSHFNDETVLDAGLYAVMGVTVAVLWLAGVVVAVLMFRQPLPDRATAWAIRLGSGIGVVGLALGFLMSQPTPEQLSGEVVGTVGAHSVGVPDGGPHLPLTGWAATGGDLRIAHFTGMHALQVLPLLALALAAAARRHPEARLADPAVRTRLVIVTSAGYLGLVALVTWQALRGQPLIAPDAPTLIAAGVLALAWLTGTLLALRRSPRQGQGPQATAEDATRHGEEAARVHDRVA